MLIWMDSFDTRNDEQSADIYTNFGNGLSITPNGRRATNCLETTTAGVADYSLRGTLKATLVGGEGYAVCGYALSVPTAIEGTTLFSVLIPSGGINVYVNLRSDGGFDAGGSIFAAPYQSPPNLFRFGAGYQYVEVKIQPSKQEFGPTIYENGMVEVRVNNRLVWSIYDKRLGAHGAAPSQFFPYNTGWQLILPVFGTRVDDLYVADSKPSGLYGYAEGITDFLGEQVIVPLVPENVGAFTQWTPSPAELPNWDTVEDRPADDTDFIYHSGDAAALDTYQIEDLPITPPSITALAVNFRAMRTDVGIRAVTSALVLSGGAAPTLYPHTETLNQDWTNYQHVFVHNPATELPWTKAQVDALEAGMLVLSGTLTDLATESDPVPGETPQVGYPGSYEVQSATDVLFEVDTLMLAPGDTTYLGVTWRDALGRRSYDGLLTSADPTKVRITQPYKVEYALVGGFERPTIYKVELLADITEPVALEARDFSDTLLGTASVEPYGPDPVPTALEALGCSTPFVLISNKVSTWNPFQYSLPVHAYPCTRDGRRITDTPLVGTWSVSDPDVASLVTWPGMPYHAYVAGAPSVIVDMPDVFAIDFHTAIGTLNFVDADGRTLVLPSMVSNFTTFSRALTVTRAWTDGPLTVTIKAGQATRIKLYMVDRYGRMQGNFSGGTLNRVSCSVTNADPAVVSIVGGEWSPSDFGVTYFGVHGLEVGTATVTASFGWIGLPVMLEDPIMAPFTHSLTLTINVV